MTASTSSGPSSKRILFGTTVGMSARALLRGQLSWFREQGWHVTLVTSPDIDAKRAAEHEGVPLIALPMKRNISPLHDLRSLRLWIRFIRQTQPHVVNLGTPKASLLGGIAAWVCRVPRRIYTVRGLRLEGASGVIAKLLWFTERATIAMATDIIAVSPSLGQELVRHKLASPNNIWIIENGSSNGVDSVAIQRQIARVDKAQLREKLGIHPHSFVVGYIGRVSKSKGVDTLLEALQHKELTNNVELLVVGAIEDRSFEEAIAAMGDRSHIVPWTADVWGFLPAMDALVLPTLREGFPNVVIEAAAAGIPAITTRATGAIDSVHDEETGYTVSVGDVGALVERINMLANSKDLRDRLGSNAKRRVEEKFRPLNIWRGIEAIALGQQGSPRIKRLDQLLGEWR